jgi:hypothetical protein
MPQLNRIYAPGHSAISTKFVLVPYHTYIASYFIMSNSVSLYILQVFFLDIVNPAAVSKLVSV